MVRLTSICQQNLEYLDLQELLLKLAKNSLELLLRRRGFFF
jgi:hypothetical protein